MKPRNRIRPEPKSLRAFCCVSCPLGSVIDSPFFGLPPIAAPAGTGTRRRSRFRSCGPKRARKHASGSEHARAWVRMLEPRKEPARRPARAWRAAGPAACGLAFESEQARRSALNCFQKDVAVSASRLWPSGVPLVALGAEGAASDPTNRCTAQRSPRRARQPFTACRNRAARHQLFPRSLAGHVRRLLEAPCMPHAELAHAHALLHVNGASAAGPGMLKLLLLQLRNEDTMKRSSPSTTLQVVFWDHRALFWLPVVQTSK